MNTKAQRRSAEEQFQLITECRSSGLSDYQWCTEHGINPGTFYNWVKRLRQKACYDVPQATCRGSFKASASQEVVPVEIISAPQKEIQSSVISSTDKPNAGCTDGAVYSIRISYHDVKIDLSNDVNPDLLSRILISLGTSLC